MTEHIKMPAGLIDLIDWDTVHENDGGSISDEDDEGERCPIWEAWRHVTFQGEDKDDELHGLICTQTLMNLVPSEEWHDEVGPESWVELNDMIARLSGEERERIETNAREIVAEVLAIARQLKESGK